MAKPRKKIRQKENMKEVNDTLVFGHSEISFKVNYPSKNPDNYLEDITNTLDYLGLFDDFKRNTN